MANPYAFGQVDTSQLDRRRKLIDDSLRNTFDTHAGIVQMQQQKALRDQTQQYVNAYADLMRNPVVKDPMEKYNKASEITARLSGIGAYQAADDINRNFQTWASMERANRPLKPENILLGERKIGSRTGYAYGRPSEAGGQEIVAEFKPNPEEPNNVDWKVGVNPQGGRREYYDTRLRRWTGVEAPHPEGGAGSALDKERIEKELRRLSEEAVELGQNIKAVDEYALPHPVEKGRLLKELPETVIKDESGKEIKIGAEDERLRQTMRNRFVNELRQKQQEINQLQKSAGYQVTKPKQKPQDDPLGIL